MKNKILVLIFLCIAFAMNAQQIVELACSYDTQYANKIGTGTTPEARIEAIIDEVNNVYDNYGLQFIIVGIESFGSMNLAGTNINATDRVTGAWVNGDDLCYKRDLVIHFTGSNLTYPTVNGESSGYSLCKSNSTDYFSNGNINPYAVITKFQGFYHEVRTAAHELGHGLGLGHEPESVCDGPFQAGDNNNPFMCCCGEGPSPSQSTNFYLGAFNVQDLQSTLASNLASCTNSFDFDPDVECTEFMAGWMTDVEISTACGEGMKEAKFTIVNDEEPRSFSNNRLIIRPWSELNFSSNINQLPQHFYDANIDEMWLTIPNLSLAANEKYELEFEVNYDNITTDFSANDVIANILFRSQNFSPPFDGQTNTTIFTRAFYPEDRSIVITNGSNTQDLLDAIQDKLNTANNDVNEIEILLEGDFIVDQDLSLDRIFTIKMANDARINVINASTFTMMNNAIIPCSYMRWDQIFVESGANINFRNVYMRKGDSGIRTEVNPNNNMKSDIMIDNCTIEDFSYRGISIECPSESTIKNNSLSDVGGYGIYIDGDSEIINFANNKVDEVDYGVRIIDNPYATHIDNLTITNTKAGLMMVNSSGILENSTFGKNIFSIYMHQAHGSTIQNSTIGYNLYGITFEDNSSMSIINNEIGLSDNYGGVGIHFSTLGSSTILGNDILASTYGIRGLQATDVDVMPFRDELGQIIAHNVINISGDQNTASGGISFTTATECDIEDNFIYASEVAYGIEMNNSSLNEINDNYVSISSIPNLFRSAAIRTMGSIGEEIIENETYSSDNGNGILAQNSSDGWYECNAIYDTHDALCIEHNSESQHIETNYKIDAHNFDFVTRSRLGIQENEGNEYWEGSVRGFWNPATFFEDLSESQFLVDEDDTYHMPSDPIPGNNEWYFPNGELDEQCSLGDIGPGGQLTFFGDPTKLCDYWDDIKALKNNDPNLFLIKVMHIIRYFDIRPWLTMPDCIKLDPVFISLCGIHDIMDNVDKLRQLGSIHPSRASLEQDISNILSLQEEYASITDPVSKEAKKNNLRNAIDASRPAMVQESTSDLLELQIIKNDLNTIQCLDPLVVKSRDVWINYISELEETDLFQNPRVDSNMESISQLCSDEYGDAIHLARSIVSVQGSHTYYDVYDGCQDVGYGGPRSSIDINPISMAVFPNPSNGLFNIDLGYTTQGKLTLLSFQGQLVKEIVIIDQSELNIEIEESGIYFLRFVNNSGESVSKKIICIK